MLKKTFTYQNYEGQSVTEDLYFNLSTPEIARLSEQLAGADKDLGEYLEEVMETANVMKIITVISKIVQAAYGKRIDNNRFSKSPEIVSQFVESAAFEQYIDTLITDKAEARLFTSKVLSTSKVVQMGAAERLATGNTKVGNVQLDEDTLREMAGTNSNSESVIKLESAKGVSEPNVSTNLQAEFEAFLASRQK